MKTRRTGPDARIVSTSIRLPTDEYLRLKRRAEKAHLSLSDYVRRKLGTSINYWVRGQSPAPGGGQDSRPAPQGLVRSTARGKLQPPGPRVSGA